MKKLIILLFIIVCLTCSFSGCSEKTTPKENFDLFMSYWETNNYSQMYNILDSESKAQITNKDFEEKYKSIYEKIKAEKIEVTAEYPAEFEENDSGNIEIPFKVKLNSIAGEISFSHKASFKKEKVEDKDFWVIKWDSTLIFPDLGSQDTIAVKRLYGTRGELYDRNDKPLAINGLGGRTYPNRSSSGYLTGYAREIRADELKDEKYKDYVQGEVIGASGLEYHYEDKLKQKTGFKIYIADSTGNEKKELAKKEPQDGEKIKLTIDVDVQNAIYAQLQNDSAVGVAMNPSTGEVLAIVNAPNYDPNSPKIPGINKSRYAYSPGSTFKLITAAIGLNNGTLDPNKDRKIIGNYWQKPSWKDFRISRVHAYNPPSTLREALIYSDNIYFAQVAIDMGKENLSTGVKNFGIGEDFPFDIPLARQSQIVNKGTDISSEGQLATTGFGQGQILMNPIHLTTIYSMLANDGNIPKPKLIYEDNMKPEIWKSNVCTKEQNDLLVSHLREVVTDPNGTAYQLSSLQTQIAGKTGTAELKATKDENGQENGWFVGYDTQNKNFALCIFVEGVQDRGLSGYCVEKAKPIFELFCK